MTEIEVTARKATGVPSVVREVGRDRDDQREQHDEQHGPGGRAVLPRRRQRLCPGTAPSREKANVIRDALVTHAMPQNSCPTVEIRMTALAAAELSADAKIASAGKPAA